jgi:hypothetical protein
MAVCCGPSVSVATPTHAVALVAIDMPLAQTPIVGRRVSDSAVSRAHGGRKCGANAPNARNVPQDPQGRSVVVRRYDLNLGTGCLWESAKSGSLFSASS